MFELGLRLAFDKPTIIVKDDKTSYSFDTSPIEHLGYPRDLRFGPIVEFKASLAEKIRSTVEKAKSDNSYTTFLKHFGTFKVARIDTEEVSKEQFIIEELRSLRQLVVATQIPRTAESSQPVPTIGRRTILCLLEAPRKVAEEVASAISARNLGDVISVDGAFGKHMHIKFRPSEDMDRDAILDLARKSIPNARWLPVPASRRS